MSPPNGVPPGSDEKRYVAVPREEEEDNMNEDGITSTAAAAETAVASNGAVAVGDGGEVGVEDEDEDAEVVVPPDGGWGWVVVAASFACNMIVDGIIFSFGMFLTEISTTFDVTKAKVALIGSLMSGFYLMTGPFASALANRFGFRLVAILGSILGAIAFALSYFSTSVPYLYFSYGILGGVGFGLIYVPAVITVGFYFEKYRALATGIGVCGSGIGTFLFAPISAILVEKMGWRNALIVQGCIVLTCIFFGSLFRPVKPTKVKDLKNRKSELVMDSDKLPVATREKMESALKNIGNSIHSISQSQGTLNKILGANNNADYPSAAEVYHTITVPTQNKPARNGEKRLSVPFINESDKPKEAQQPLLNNKGSTPMIISSRRPSGHRPRTTSDASHPRSRRGTLTEVNRPLYRDDVFFGASLNRLPQYQSQSSLAYHLSVTRLPTKEDIEEEVENKGGCKMCPESVRRTLATMLDVSLLKSPSFLLLALSGLFTMMGFYVPFMYIVDRAELNGWTNDQAIWLVSAIGVANTIGRVLCGMLSFAPKIDTLMVNNVAISIGGIATFFSGYSGSQEYQYFYAIVFGLSISTFASLRSILVVELLGLEKLTNAFGLLLLFQGVAAAVGSPMAGAFMDATGSYDASFYLSGSLIFISAVMCYPLNWINRWEKRKLEQKESRSVPI